MEDRFGILIVEDDLLQSLMLVKVIESLNHIVIGTTIYGENAVELATELNPDIIFIDISLAGKMDGIETAQQINQESEAAIFYITGNSLLKDNKRLKKTNFEDFLLKPISKVEIKEAITKYSGGNG